MTSTAEGERLDMRQPFQQQLLALTESCVAMLAQNGEDGLVNSARLHRSKKPQTQSRELVREEGDSISTPSKVTRCRLSMVYLSEYWGAFQILHLMATPWSAQEWQDSP